ncbi:UNVERIFIED_CONTAM: hypothetical protein FKN15_063891 [Acipenser sinensis]
MPSSVETSIPAIVWGSAIPESPSSHPSSSPAPDSTKCLRCPSDQWSNTRQDACVPRLVEFLSYEEPLGASLASLAVLASLLPASILGVFLRHRHSPIVKANNRQLSYVLLCALALCPLCSLIFIGRPSPASCMLRQTAFAIVFTLGVSCVLAKTLMVVIAFKASIPGSGLRRWVGSRLPNTVASVGTLVQVGICGAWLGLASPYPENNTTAHVAKIVLECNEGSALAFWCMLGYMGVLASVSFVVAFLARRLPDSFNEAKFITFSMLVFVSVWLSFIPAYMSTGGKYMSRVINNQYNRLYAIDLYLEHQWADDQWEATQHRSFKPVRTLFIAETPFVINNTIPEEKVFTVTLGIFNPDVELKNLTINGVPLTLPEAVNQGIVVTEVQHPNGTKSFVLKVPFTHPLIPQKYVGDGVREFTLNINYTLNILPENEPYFHPATIVCRVKDVVLPVIKGSCTENSIVFEGTHGNMDYFWVVYIGKHQLTSELAANRGYIFTNLTKFIVEVPVFSVGCICEDISLRGVSVRVELTLRSAATLEVVLSSIQRCQFPTKQLLVCMPNGVMTVVAVTMEPIPVVEPSKTTLLDKNCKPKEFDSTRALFTFSVNTCGTRSKIVGNYLIYENEVVYTRALFPPNAPVITRDSEYR